MYGLLDRDITDILLAIGSLKEIEKAVIYGSRALGNYKKGSDVDIAILGKDVTEGTIYNLYDMLNEVYPLPYFFDIINYNKINNINLKNHIDDVGKIIFKR